LKHLQAITTAAELVGFGLITTGAALVWEPLGFIVGGSALVLVGYLFGRKE
jgi:hypothetical protein